MAAGPSFEAAVRFSGSCCGSGFYRVFSQMSECFSGSWQAVTGIKGKTRQDGEEPGLTSALAAAGQHTPDPPVCFSCAGTNSALGHSIFTLHLHRTWPDRILPDRQALKRGRVKLGTKGAWNCVEKCFHRLAGFMNTAYRNVGSGKESIQPLGKGWHSIQTWLYFTCPGEEGWPGSRCQFLAVVVETEQHGHHCNCVAPDK